MGLRDSRFPALAGWHRDYDDIFGVLNHVTKQVLEEFRLDGAPARPRGEYGRDGKAFGYGTVHHATGSLRMPSRPTYVSPFSADSVVDEDLQVLGMDNLYVCDMSVLPFSSAANPCEPWLRWPCASPTTSRRSRTLQRDPAGQSRCGVASTAARSIARPAT